MGVVALATTMIALAITSTAHAAATRAEYVAQVDQVCRDATPQFQALIPQFKKLTRGLDSVRTESDAHEKKRLNRLYRGLGRYVAATARIFGGMVDGVALVSPAPDDELAVAQWISGFRQFVDLQAQSAPAWKHHRLGRAAGLSEQSVEAINNGGAAVKDFGISVCLTHIDVPTVSYE
jgi:hypothetical protein